LILALMELAKAISEAPAARGLLVVVASRLTEQGARRAWDDAAAVMKPALLSRLTLILASDGATRAIPVAPPAEMMSLAASLVAGAPKATGTHRRVGFEFVVLKLLIHQWLTRPGEAMTTARLMQMAGCTYPTASKVIRSLGNVIERRRDRRILLRYLPEDLWRGLVAGAPRARVVARFVNGAGQARSPEAHIRRLETLRPAGVAIGGVIGARHFEPALDMIGAPRLDLSVHSAAGAPDLSFVQHMDPALVPEPDPARAADVVVHAVRHADPLFLPRSEGLHWCDPVECLLDLNEAGLTAQATQLFDALLKRRENQHGR
jgi:hypothetical protein